MKILEKRFFNKPVVKVAKNLLGKFLVRRIGRKQVVSMITEVEVYDGSKDRASHAYRGKTIRNAPMFGAGGIWYVYLTYGMYWMLNIVTGSKDYPAAVLIRGVQDAQGPGRLTEYFKIDKRFNNKIAHKKTGLWIEDRRVRVKAGDIKKSKRIGVEYAGKYWAGRKLRFLLSKQE